MFCIPVMVILIIVKVNQSGNVDAMNIDDDYKNKSQTKQHNDNVLVITIKKYIKLICHC